MDFDKMSSTLLRLFVGGSFFFLILAVVLKAADLMGKDLIVGIGPRVLLDWAVVLLVFSTVLLLRQIREALKNSEPLNS